MPTEEAPSIAGPHDVPLPLTLLQGIAMVPDGCWPLPLHLVQAVQCAGPPRSRRRRPDQSITYEGVMSKGMDQKKNQKKEPTRTLKEKRAAKQEKKNGK
jgi:hypothetical protein